MTIRLHSAIIALATTAFLSGPLAHGARAETGYLECQVAGGWGYVLGSSKRLACVFSPADGGPAEHYTGEIQKLGLDVGYTESGVILWAVIAPNLKIGSGALAGTYVGASAEASAGLGVGSNVLVGGGNSIALQPVSVGGQEGLNVAGGIGTVVLRPAN